MLCKTAVALLIMITVAHSSAYQQNVAETPEQLANYLADRIASVMEGLRIHVRKSIVEWASLHLV